MNERHKKCMHSKEYTINNWVTVTQANFQSCVIFVEVDGEGSDREGKKF